MCKIYIHMNSKRNTKSDINIGWAPKSCIIARDGDKTEPKRGSNSLVDRMTNALYW